MMTLTAVTLPSTKVSSWTPSMIKSVVSKKSAFMYVGEGQSIG